MNITRRTFLGTTTPAALGAGLSVARSWKTVRAAERGANERIRMGAIGTANRGGQIIEAALAHPEVEFVALCDVQASAMDKWAAALPGQVDRYSDYRKLIERNDIDAVLIATPDHWHALQCVDACHAGKDVYVEKPLSITIAEGRRMIEVARETRRIVQVGLHRRSSPLFFKAEEAVKTGELGKVSVGTAYRISNMFPDGIGKCQPCDPPPDLDWGMWLGPRAMRPYQPNITPYKFRWWKDYSSQIGNWGVHYFDLMRWLTGEEAPAVVTAHGGRYVVDDDRTIPDTMQVTFEFASGWLMVFGQYEASGNNAFPKHGMIELRGTKGAMYVTDRGYEIVPATGGQFQDPQPRIPPVEYKVPGNNQNHTELHMRNFLDCIKSRQRPTCDVEEGHKSTVFAHLANIAMDMRTRIEWDSAAERITNNTEANTMLDYEYRAPWKLG